MTQLSRLAILGLAKETTAGTYVTPSTYIPFTKADFEDQYAEIKDQSYRANDSVLQGMYQGPVVADWSWDVLAYPDLIGHFLRGIIGPDTVTAGVSTTLSSSSSIGATTVSTAASIAAGSIVLIDSAGTAEYAKVTAVSGSGPYTLTVTTSDATSVGLAKAHTSGATVVAASTHTFKQSTNPANKATYSLTVYDTVQTLSYSDVVLSDLSVKIDPKNAVTCSVKAKALPGVSASAMTPTFTALPPVLGWQWNMTNAGGSSSRGLTFDTSFKRAVDPIHSSDGTIGPREIFQGSIEVDGSYKAIFENTTDLDLYLQYAQLPATALLQQPISAGGASLGITLSKSGWHKGKRDLGSSYVQASFSLSGIYNTTDGGSASVVLKNFQSAAY